MTDHDHWSGRLLDEPDDDYPTVRQVEYVHDGTTRTRTTYWYDPETALADLKARLVANPHGRWGYVVADDRETVYRVHRRTLVR